MAQREASVTLAVAALGAAHVGIAVDAVLGAIAARGTLTALPRRQGALCGVAEHRGRLVPVVDLTRWVDVGAAADGHANAGRVMLLSDGRRTIGLKVDAIVGLTDVAAPALSRIHHDHDPQEVFHSMAKSEPLGVLLSVLDVGRLIDLATAWHDQGAPAGIADGAPADAADADPGAPLCALLAAGAATLALPAAELAEVIALPELLAIGPVGSNRYCAWRDRTIPVIDAAALLGQPDAGAGGLLAIVRRGGLSIGLRVSRAIELRTLGTPAAAAHGAIATTVVVQGAGAVEVIDTAALFERTPEAAISHSAPSAPGAEAERRANGGAYIVFQTGQLVAAPIEAMEEILPLLAAQLDARRGAAASMEWRGQAVPLADLRGPQQGPAATAAARIIIVRGHAGHIGYVVRQVLLLIPPHAGWLYQMRPAGAGAVEFITTGEGQERISYRTLDLAHPPAA